MYETSPELPTATWPPGPCENLLIDAPISYLCNGSKKCIGSVFDDKEAFKELIIEERMLLLLIFLG